MAFFGLFGTKPAATVDTQDHCDVKKPKPCCVCKDEKSVRDECMLLYGQESDKCNDLVLSYKSCMKGFGFTI